MFTRDEIALIREALDFKLKSIKRLAVNQPLFVPVAEKQALVYSELSLKVEKSDVDAPPTRPKG